MSGVAHSPQNLNPGGFSIPHWGHRRLSGMAHSPQNFIPSGFSDPQLSQRMLPLYSFGHSRTSFVAWVERRVDTSKPPMNPASVTLADPPPENTADVRQGKNDPCGRTSPLPGACILAFLPSLPSFLCDRGKRLDTKTLDTLEMTPIVGQHD